MPYVALNVMHSSSQSVMMNLGYVLCACEVEHRSESWVFKLEATAFINDAATVEPPLDVSSWQPFFGEL